MKKHLIQFSIYIIAFVLIVLFIWFNTGEKTRDKIPKITYLKAEVKQTDDWVIIYNRNNFIWNDVIVEINSSRFLKRNGFEYNIREIGYIKNYTVIPISAFKKGTESYIPRLDETILKNITIYCSLSDDYVGIWYGNFKPTERTEDEKAKSRSGMLKNLRKEE